VIEFIRRCAPPQATLSVRQAALTPYDRYASVGGGNNRGIVELMRACLVWACLDLPDTVPWNALIKVAHTTPPDRIPHSLHAPRDT
jgi:hypothetical protein